MKTFEIEIESFDRNLEAELLERDSYSTGETYDISIGRIALKAKHLQEEVGASEIIGATISCAVTVSAGVLANWLWSKLEKKSIRHLSINRKEIHIDKGEIKKIIEETLNLED